MFPGANDFAFFVGMLKVLREGEAQFRFGDLLDQLSVFTEIVEHMGVSLFLHVDRYPPSAFCGDAV